MGGLLFAFSPYMLTRMADGLLLMLVFPVPLAAWVTLRHLASELKARSLHTSAKEPYEAATDMYFRMSGDYLSAVPPVPSEHIRWPIVAGLYNDVRVPRPAIN